MNLKFADLERILKMNTSCKKCQAVIEPHAQFCSHCGTNQEVILPQGEENEPNSAGGEVTTIHQAINNIQRKYEFEKRKYIGNLKYLVIDTSINLDQSSMGIKQEKKSFYVFKKTTLNTKINYN